MNVIYNLTAGIMIYFEVYKGKVAMSTKEYTKSRAKHVALTLRMLKPFFGKVDPTQPRATSPCPPSHGHTGPTLVTAKAPDCLPHPRQARVRRAARQTRRDVVTCQVRAQV